MLSLRQWRFTLQIPKGPPAEAFSFIFQLSDIWKRLNVSGGSGMHGKRLNFHAIVLRTCTAALFTTTRMEIKEMIGVPSRHPISTRNDF